MKPLYPSRAALDDVTTALCMTARSVGGLCSETPEKSVALSMELGTRIAKEGMKLMACGDKFVTWRQIRTWAASCLRTMIEELERD